MAEVDPHRRPSVPRAGAPPVDPSSFRAAGGSSRWGRLFDEGTLAKVGLVLERDLEVTSARPPSG